MAPVRRGWANHLKSQELPPEALPLLTWRWDGPLGGPFSPLQFTPGTLDRPAPWSWSSVENEPHFGQSANSTEDYIVAKVNMSKLLEGAEEGGSLCYVLMKEASHKLISKWRCQLLQKRTIVAAEHIKTTLRMALDWSISMAMKQRPSLPSCFFCHSIMHKLRYSF